MTQANSGPVGPLCRTLLALSLSALLSPSHANVWSGGVGDWNDGANWSTGVPVASDDVLIDSTSQAASTVSLNTTATVRSVTIDAGDALNQLNAHDLSIAGGGVINNGSWTMLGTGSDTFLQFVGAQTLGGGGELVLADDPQNRIITNNTLLTHGVGHTIRGGGQLLNNTGGMINEGTILADAAEAIAIDPNGLGFTNSGTMTATGSGGFSFLAGVFENAGESIDIGDGSKLVLHNGAMLKGGELNTAGSGVVEVKTLATLDGVTSNGNVVQGNSHDVDIKNGLTNNGSWTMNGTGSDTYVQFVGAQAVTGSGEIVLGGASANRIITNNTTVTNGAAHTIRGGGQLLNNTGGMINEGTILADDDAVLAIDPNGLGFTNKGTMTATGSGGFSFLAGVFDNTGESIDIEEDSKLVLQNGAMLKGGELNTTGSGVVEVMTLATLDGVTSNATVVQGNSHDVDIKNGLTNNGSWAMNGTGSDTYIQFVGDQEVAGSGEIVLGGASANRIITNNTTVTNGANHTIRGGGQLLNNTGGMINEGTILADDAAVLAIDPNGLGFTNNGTMTATGSGGFSFLAGVFDNTDERIDIEEGSKLVLHNGAMLKGGELNTTGSGVVEVMTLATLDGVTSNATVVQGNSHDVDIKNGLTNNGSWTMNGTGSDTYVQFVGDQTLGGSGELVLDGASVNRIITNNRTVTNGADHTIRGGGQLLNNFGGMINEGTILADGDAVLAIDPNALGFTNSGTMTASGSGGFSFLAGVFDNTGHSIDIGDGSKLVLQNGAMLKGGELNTAGSGVVEVKTLSTLDGVTTNGVVVQGNSHDVDIKNGLTNNGSWTMNGTGSDTYVQFVGDQTLGGSGELVLGGASVNRILTTNATLTNDVDHTIRGGGRLLANFGGLINKGAIIADAASHVIEIDANALGFRNAAGGRLYAIGDAGIDVKSGGFVNEGDVRIASNSQLSRVGDYTQTGGLTRVDGILTLTQPTTTIVDLQGGILDGHGRIDGDVINTGGTIGAGMAVGEAGTLTLDGMLTQSELSTMLVEIGGSEQGVTYDLVNILDANAMIDGTLSVSMLDEFVPVLGETFDVLTAVSVTGEFEELLFPVFSGLTFEIQYLADRVRLTTTAVPVPAAVWLFGSSLLGLLGVARRRKA